MPLNTRPPPVVYFQGRLAAMAAFTASCPAMPSDEQLLACFAAGRREALEELFRRYRAPAYRVAHRLLSHEADALDAVQEGFVKASPIWIVSGVIARSRPGCCASSATPPSTWGGSGRRETVRLPGEGPVEGDGGPAVPENPTRRLEQADLRSVLDEALASLPEAQRRTFVLHADAGLSYREVAETLGISIGTVMSRLYYARLKLRAFLAERTGSL